MIISLKLKLFKGVALITELLKQLYLQNTSLANLAYLSELIAEIFPTCIYLWLFWISTRLGTISFQDILKLNRSNVVSCIQSLLNEFVILISMMKIEIIT